MCGDVIVVFYRIIVGIKYGDPVCASETIYLGGNKIRWESSVCHLGNYFDTKLSDMIDCKKKCSRFIGSVNRVMANFGCIFNLTI